MRRPLLALLLLLGAPALAQPEPEWRGAPEYDVLLRPFAFEPRIIRLEAGRPVRLRFVNGGRATHSFHAPRFFRTARLRAEDGDIVTNGYVRLASGERRTVALVPAPGRYPVRSFGAVQWALGMRAVIVVE